MLIDIVELGKIVGAMLTIFGVFMGVYRFFKVQIFDRLDRLEREEKETKEHQDEIEEHQKEHIDSSQEEFLIIIKALSACLDGLIQQGCNHTVPVCKEELDQFLLKKSHHKE